MTANIKIFKTSTKIFIPTCPPFSTVGLATHAKIFVKRNFSLVMDLKGSFSSDTWMNIALLSSKFNDLCKQIRRLMEEAARVGLQLKARKCRTLRTEFTRNREIIVVNGEEVEDVEEFVYLGAIVDKEGRGSKDIRNRPQKARGAC